MEHPAPPEPSLSPASRSMSSSAQNGGVLVLPCEAEGSIPEDFELYRNSSGADRDGPLLRILEAHPFVKQGLVERTNRPEHKFECVRHQLDVRGFQKWLKTETGAPFKKAAGGVTDDGLYTLSPVLREVLPRGLHSVTATSTSSDAQHTLWFRGIYKFTGLSSTDEDEQSNSHDANFFHGGKSLEQAHHLTITRKSNGENAKVSLVLLDGVRYLFVGSKQTCRMFPAQQPAANFYQVDDQDDLASTLAGLVSDWYLAKDSAAQDALFAEFIESGFCTIMGELNRPWAEHLIPIDKLFLETYSLLDAADGRCCSPSVAFSFFDRHGFGAAESTASVRQVWHAVAPVQELESVVSTARAARGNEGVVIYACDSENEVLGLLKVKASEYVIKRRIREVFKGKIMVPLRHSEILGLELIGAPRTSNRLRPEGGDEDSLIELNEVRDKLQAALSTGMRKLTHVEHCEELSGFWVKFSTGFADWWVEHRLEALVGLTGEPTEQRVAALEGVLLEFDGRFASLVASYERDCGSLVTAMEAAAAAAQMALSELPEWWPQGCSTAEALGVLFEAAAEQCGTSLPLGFGFVSLPGFGGLCFKMSLSWRALVPHFVKQGLLDQDIVIAVEQLPRVQEKITAAFVEGRSEWLTCEHTNTHGNSAVITNVTVSAKLGGVMLAAARGAAPEQ